MAILGNTEVWFLNYTLAWMNLKVMLNKIRLKRLHAVSFHGYILEKNLQVKSGQWLPDGRYGEEI